MGLIGISGQISSGKDTVAQMIQFYTSEHGINNTRSFQESIGKIDTQGYGYADFTKYNSPWEIKKFAGKLKQIVSILTGCNVNDLESEDFKSSILPKEWNVQNFVDKNNFQKEKQLTYREVLQKLGTDLLRDGLHQKVHINSLFADFIPYCVDELGIDVRFPNWLITDTRFENEFDAIKERNGICIRVERFLSSDQWKEKFNHIGSMFDCTDSDKISKSGYINLLQFRGYKNEKFYSKYLHQSEIGLDNYYTSGRFDHIIYNDGTLEDLEEKVKEFIIKFKLNENDMCKSKI